MRFKFKRKFYSSLYVKGWYILIIYDFSHHDNNFMKINNFELKGIIKRIIVFLNIKIWEVCYILTTNIMCNLNSFSNI